MGSPDHSLTIDVLYSPECPHVADAEREIARAIEATSAYDAHVHFTSLSSERAAGEQGFTGSPTVRVNGQDVQHAGEEVPPEADACRDYVGPNGVVLPYPPASVVADAIRDARE